MRTIRLGTTTEQVSALCLGSMYYGTSVNRAVSYRLLDQYVDAGGMFIDTANIYAWWAEGGLGGESEKLLGDWLKERKNRSNLFIASKVGFGYGSVPRGLSARLIREECEKSLRQMQIETIDLYYAHVDDPNTPMDETLEAFNRLVEAGKVRYIGASNFRAWRLEQARNISQSKAIAGYSCVQQRYTYLQPRPGTSFEPQLAANEDLLDYCQKMDLTILAYSPLLSGAYTRMERPIASQYLSDDNQVRLQTLRSVATECGATPNQVILAWMLQSSPLILPVFAASTREQMEEDISALKLELTEAQMKQLNEAGTK
ncbi:MAG: aldo/keto reductase [Anaerolineaceae bacterium]|nr:aldo/keto reductase [Anaerolineaceae bacterium]